MGGYLDPGLSRGTERLLAEARELVRRGTRLFWLSLPSQRDYYLYRLGEEGPLLGVEVMHFQALYQRYVALHDPPEGMVSPGERVALVAEALFKRGWLNSPGEARLFARAIAELKRFGLKPQETPVFDGETKRLAAVFADYERLKGKRADPDDIAWRAVALAEEGRRLEAGAVFVAGFLELSPREVRFLKALKPRHEVRAVLGEEAGLGLYSLGEANPPRLEFFKAENPVHELRWVLAEIKADVLERGIPPHKIALVLPEEKLAEAETLAREYELALANEAYRALADTRDGGRLYELLTFAERPSGERLFFFPGFERLGKKALILGLVGKEALLKLARELGEEEKLTRLFSRFLPGEDPLAWAEELIDSDEVLRESPYREAFLERAREAFRAGGKEDFVRWWASLLKSVRTRQRQPVGIALLTPDAAVGRRYQKAYLAYATAGAYAVGEREGYFFPEERRLPLGALYAGEKGLPRRIRGRDEKLFKALLSLAEEVVVSYPATEGGEPLSPEPGLFGKARPKRMPPPRPASALGYRPLPPRRERFPGLPPPRSLYELELWDRRGRCGFRVYLERLRLRRYDEEAWGDERWQAYWYELYRAKREGRRPSSEALVAFRMREEEWRRLELGRLLTFKGLSVRVFVPARETRDGEVRVYAFGNDPAENPEKKLKERLSEVLAAASHPSGATVYYWGLGGRPQAAFFVAPGDERALERLERARELLDLWNRSKAEPRPNHYCRFCPYVDVCRRA